jgi:hypothetical protein
MRNGIGVQLFMLRETNDRDMSRCRAQLQPDARDIAKWHRAVRYGIGVRLQQEMRPEADVPQCFRDLVRALEKAERERKA